MIPLLLSAQRRLQQVLGLSPDVAARAVAETLDALTVDVDTYITSRHAELKAQGLDNSEIYGRISAELPSMRFASKRLTARQIRRRIYG